MGYITNWIGNIANNRSAPAIGVFAVLLSVCLLAGCKGSSSRPTEPDASATPGQVAPVAHSAACNVPFYPADSAARWQYNVAFGANSLTLALSRTSIEFGTFTDHLQFSDGSIVDMPWTCTEEGLICSNFLPVDLGHFASAFKLRYTRGTGPTLPAMNSWNVGYHWTCNYSVVGQRASNNAGLQEASGTLEMDNNIVSSANVTVPAGTFQAFQIDSTVLETLTIRSGSTTGSTLHVALKTSAWYAKDVGLVRMAFSGDPGTGKEELTSFTK